MARATNPSGQLDVLELLQEQNTRAVNALTDLVDTLNPQIDANPEDKLLMEVFDVVTDAQESLHELRDLLITMERRDREAEA